MGDWMAGGSADLPMHLWTDEPVVARVSGYLGQQKEPHPLLNTIPALVGGLPGESVHDTIAIQYDRLIADAQIGWLFDANYFDDGTDHRDQISTDQIEVGFRLFHMSDRLDEPHYDPTNILGGFFQVDRDSSRVMNNAFLPYLTFSRAVDWRKFQFQFAASAFGGINFAHRSLRRDQFDPFLVPERTSSSSKLTQSTFMTGQRMRLSGTYRYNDSIDLTLGTMIDRTTNLSTAISERTSFSSTETALDSITFRFAQLYMAARMSY